MLSEGEVQKEEKEELEVPQSSHLPITLLRNQLPPLTIIASYKPL